MSSRLPQKNADKVVTLVFRELIAALAKGDRVKIRGFGSLKIKHYDGYMGTQAESGKEIFPSTNEKHGHDETSE